MWAIEHYGEKRRNDHKINTFDISVNYTPEPRRKYKFPIIEPKGKYNKEYKIQNSKSNNE